MKLVRRYAAVAMCFVAPVALIAGCTTSRPAPVSERSIPPRTAAAKPAPATVPAPARAAAVPEQKREVYTVKPGDTLYSIALEHGVDYRELALWNGIDNPGSLKIGQQLRVVPTPPPSGTGVVAAPLKTPGGTIQGKPLGAGPIASPAAPAAPATAAAPAAPGAPATPATVTTTPAPGGIAAPSSASSAALVTEPKGIRLPYSDQALAQLAARETTNQPKPEARVEAKPSSPEPKADTARVESTDWIWPAKGKVVANFNGTTNKGIDISGPRGQAVLATAAGRVIFSGTGVRGMGKFVVIKHSEELISVYGHNDEVVVKYGQNVTKGQKIAEMGSTDADQVKLHFEIRRNGTPVDPLTFLPNAT